GKMYAAGWHQSFECNKVLVTYAPKRSEAALKLYKEAAQDLPLVAACFKECLCTLNSHAYIKLKKASFDNQVPSFDNLEFDGLQLEDCFANSFTATNHDFSNFQHKDNDHIDVSYGMWWAAKYSEKQKQYVLDQKIDHNQVKGGGFLIGKYGIGIDMERCKGLVEIQWRGKTDDHGTLASHSQPETTRFGTSIQITKKGVAAAGRFWKKGAGNICLLHYLNG
ncbi:hypothetical protein BJ912DRAFT_850337, partial [Pholiota molesta]